MKAQIITIMGTAFVSLLAMQPVAVQAQIDAQGEAAIAPPISGHAINTKGTGGNRTRQNDLTAAQKAFDKIIGSKAFIAVEEGGDVKGMRQMLAGTGFNVITPDPQLTAICVPPYGVLVWGWYQVYGPNANNGNTVEWYSAYGQYCYRGGRIAVLANPPINYPD